VPLVHSDITIKTRMTYVRVAMAVVEIVVLGNPLSSVVETYENNSSVLASVLHLAKLSFK